ncbi:MAG: rod shape-determining protein MreC [Gammaproteobacteria bacterium]|nr:MAG: rod shape-determining protein MreC [Gammaproteobacteria bacterium]
MFADHRQHYLEDVRSALSIVVYPLQLLVNAPFKAADWASSEFRTHERLMEDNARFSLENLQLRAQLQKFDAMENENMRLRELLESSFKAGDRVLITELLRVNMEPYTHQIILNKGSRQEVFVGQPVIDAEGIMGQVVHVGPFTSTVMLITDPNHALPVEVNRNGLRSIAIGTGDLMQLELLYIPPNGDIKVGDLLVSSGLGGRFPPGYPVATITQVDIKPGQRFAKVLAEPKAELQRTRELLLVWPSPTQASNALNDAASNTAADIKPEKKAIP